VNDVNGCDAVFNLRRYNNGDPHRHNCYGSNQMAASSSGLANPPDQMKAEARNEDPKNHYGRRGYPQRGRA
jgi:hypothetical protein